MADQAAAAHTAANDAGGQGANGGCWIYSTLVPMKLARPRHLVIIRKYHDRLMSDADYAGYQVWSKPLSETFRKGWFWTGLCARMARSYAETKAYRIGMTKRAPRAAERLLEGVWDAANRICGLFAHAASQGSAEAVTLDRRVGHS